MMTTTESTTASRMERCQHILSAVSSLSTTEMDELFKILHSTKCEYSRNNNGIFINLRWVDEDVLKQIEQFMAFCNKNRVELEKYERLRSILTENFALAAAAAIAEGKAARLGAIAPPAKVVNDGDDTEDAAVEVIAAAKQIPAIVGGMTTLKFNLLKKKFAKPFNASSRFEQGDLTKESLPMLM
jgi:hypothetical protein